MNTPTAPKTGLHPVLWIAAIAIILFSLIGIAALTGLLPNKSQEASQATLTPPPPPPPLPAAEASPSAPVAATPAPAPEPVMPPPVEKPVVKHHPPKPAKHEASQHYSSHPQSGDDANGVNYSSQPAPPPPAPAPPPPCPTCAVVSSIEPVKVEGEGTGLGAIAGGVLGGILGNQIGGGSGRDVARIAGIAGGAYAGHQVEKSERAHTAYNIVVRFDEDGTTQRFHEDTQPVWRIGDKVRVENGKLVPR